jgi:putative endonuclease
MYYVYILECADGSYYVGSTNDIARRLHAHNNLKSGAHYTKIRRPVVMKYSEACESFADARRREGELKRLSKEKKMSLVYATNEAN